jgi:hypothetical protein
LKKRFREALLLVWTSLGLIDFAEATVALPYEARLAIAVTGDNADAVYRKVLQAVQARMPCEPSPPAANGLAICYVVDKYTPSQSAGVFRVFIAKPNIPTDATEESTHVIIEVSVQYRERRIDVEPVIKDLFTLLQNKYNGRPGIKFVEAYDDCERYSYSDQHRFCDF